ncbi:phenylacetyl-CoA ligase [Tepidanaerobacter acetatoxydans Re1]|uniref:Phenylacetate-coenzyme A ligase n=1 Tax=Tepidanaerobacter acetatoxydans (strain DSM 21804 / JCM 16047 / Re1) TaxID=1209989 RepID=F4LVS3_TEPAE|nr:MULTISPECIES: phenylacetate--CoA ligase [Tepidanaerobacter]AEE90770.1 Phenylacetate--CoA ligase [Tepidanaerobacter acetatoxydans Re1]CCP25325.1 phenylacetyl-CoA ligase [Tepidanaerobacter acetatoxydans Re1]
MPIIWNKKWECAPRKDIEEIQLERLKATVKRVYDNVPYYRKTLDSMGVHPQDIRKLDDIRKLPFTTKDVLRDNYPFGLFAVPKDELLRVHASSGTTGKPTVVGYTRNDLETWSELVARVVTQAGVTNKDMAQVAFGYGLFTGAFGLHYGLEKVGAAVIPVSVGNTERQIMLMQDFEATALISTPSYALYMAEVAEKMGIYPKKLPLKYGLFGSEACTEEMRQELEKRWGILVTDNYGLSEVMGPGVSGECQFQDGMHIAEDHFIVEIIDPVTEEPKDYGEEGEVVITTLTKEALPIIRYRTRDISSLNPEPCRCGRTSMRMKKISGRTDDMLIIRGVNVFPSQIESVLVQSEGLTPNYMLVVTKNGYMDELEVQVEVTEEIFTDRFKELEALEKRIVHRLYTVLGLNAKVRLVAPNSLKRFEGKAQRVKDLR